MVNIKIIKVFVAMHETRMLFTGVHKIPQWYPILTQINPIYTSDTNPLRYILILSSI
jgi:hypothetical protein